MLILGIKQPRNHLAIVNIRRSNSISADEAIVNVLFAGIPLFRNRDKSRIYDLTTLSFEALVAKESLKHFKGLLNYSRFAQPLPKKATVVSSGTLLVTSSTINFSQERLSFA